MRRLPIRARLTLAFATAMAVVLAATGFLLFNHLAVSLDQSLDQGLHARAADVAALVQQADTGLRDAHSPPVADGGFAQILDRHGRIFDQTRGLGPRPLLGGRLLAQARNAPVLIPRLRGLAGEVRLLAIPVQAQGQRLVVVVGVPLRSRDQALASLRSELLVGGPVALLVASLIGYLLAAAALKPVERMRTRASSISERHLSERLPVTAARDEIGRLGDTLNEMLARIERGMDRERRFVADASHELRSPLALLRAEVELALDLPRDEQELRAALRSIGEEADRVSQLAEDLLLLARLNEGRLPLREEPLEVQTLFDDVAARFSRRADEAGRTIDVDSADLHVAGDRLRLEQALGNLVENALRHGAGDIRLLATENRGSVEFHVTDEGAGFPDGFAPTAFERFTRADTARSGPGTGLGLAIVDAIAQAHGGHATITTTTIGADVRLSLPQQPRPDPNHLNTPSRQSSPVHARTPADSDGH